MTIIIDIRPLYSDLLGKESRQYFSLCLEQLIRQKPQITFYFITENGRPAPSGSPFSHSQIPLKNSLRGRLSGHSGYPQKMAGLIKKYNAAAFLSTSGIATRDSHVLQFVWMPFEAGSARPSSKFRRVWAGNLKRTCHSARIIFVPGEKEKLALLKDNPAAGKKIVKIPPAPDPAFMALDESAKSSLRQQFSDGKEYFLCDQSQETESGFLEILKAFSLFKKRQRSNMQLILTGINNRKKKSWKNKLDTYKYRDDLHVLAETAFEVPGLVQAAYAFLPSRIGAVSILNCLQAGVPMIARAEGLNTEVSGEFLLFRHSENLEQLAGLMMSIYKNEKMRADMILAGIRQAAAFSERASAGLLWEGLSAAISNQQP